jgi:hypothetical protein
LVNVLSQRDLAGRVVIDETVLTGHLRLFVAYSARDLPDHIRQAAEEAASSAESEGNRGV